MVNWSSRCGRAEEFGLIVSKEENYLNSCHVAKGVKFFLLTSLEQD